MAMLILVGEVRVRLFWLSHPVGSEGHSNLPSIVRFCN